MNARQGTGGLGFTPMMEAALNGRAEMVDLLLGHGADAAMRADHDMTAAAYAARNGHTALAERLTGFRDRERRPPSRGRRPVAR